MSRIRLGDMLVQAQLVQAAQIDEALALQRERGAGRLGELLVELGHVSEVQLAQVLSNQLSVPWANLYHVDFSRELLNLLPPEMAEKYGCIPVYVRKVRTQGDTLFVATDDPTNDLALAEIAVQANMPVKPMVASSTDVRNAIRVYYFGGKPSPATTPIVKRASSIAALAGRSSIAPVELDESEFAEDDETPVLLEKQKAHVAEKAATEDAAPAVEPAPAPVSAPAVEPAPAPVSVPAAASAPVSASAPAPAKKRGRMLTLTLLDGTTVKLPAATKKTAEEAPTEALTTRDLIAALQARAEGKDVSAVLPDGPWEPLFAALLSLLLRKGLIADWEFAYEWSQHRR